MYKGKFIEIRNMKRATKGIVVDCNPEKGITIVNAEDPEEILVCLSYKKGIDIVWHQAYNKLIGQIKKGFFDSFNLTGVPLRSSQERLAKLCPFNK